MCPALPVAAGDQTVLRLANCVKCRAHGNQILFSFSLKGIQSPNSILFDHFLYNLDAQAGAGGYGDKTSVDLRRFGH